MQDDLTRQIITALDVQLLHGEQALAWRRTTRNPDAYDRFLRARSLYSFNIERDKSAEAKRLFEEALELEPDFAAAAGRLAMVITFRMRSGWVADPEASLARAQALCERALALALAPAEGSAMMALANIHLIQHEWDAAVAMIQRAAEAWARQVRRIEPSFSVERFASHHLLYRNPQWRERMSTLLRQAGLE